MSGKSSSIVRNNRQSLSAKVHDYLLGQISSQAFPPGTMLKRREIAEALGVSYAPVTEAFVQLELEGYLVTTPRKGTVVRSFGPKEIAENLILREALECQAARLYCGEKIKKHYDGLCLLAVKIDETFLEEKPKNWELEYRFHSALVALSECSLLLDEFNRVMKLGSFYELYDTVFNKNKEGHVLDKHVNLLKNLCIADADQAENLIRIHLGTSSKMILGKDVFHASSSL